MACNNDEMALGAIDVAYALATGEKTEKEKWIPFKTVTPETYKIYSKDNKSF